MTKVCDQPQLDIFNINGIYRLIVAVWKMAVEDAESGNAEAIDFLNETVPDWKRIKKGRTHDTRDRSYLSPRY